jgi:hypothetical protein
MAIWTNDELDQLDPRFERPRRGVALPRARRATRPLRDVRRGVRQPPRPSLSVLPWMSGPGAAARGPRRYATVAATQEVDVKTFAGSRRHFVTWHIETNLATLAETQVAAGDRLHREQSKDLPITEISNFFASGPKYQVFGADY